MSSSSSSSSTGSHGYTASLANEPVRIERRTQPGLLTSNPTVDAVQGWFSAVLCLAFTWSLILILSVYVPFVVAYLLLSFLVGFSGDGVGRRRRGRRRQRHDNISHDAGVGSRTAQKTLAARAMYALFFPNSAPDSLAPSLMENLYPRVVRGLPMGVFLCKMYVGFVRINFALTRRVFQDQIASVFPSFKIGEVAYLQARTCWLDDCVEEFVKRTRRRRRRRPRRDDDPSWDGGKDESMTPSAVAANVVILGAGYDTRCYRLDCLRHDEHPDGSVRCYEVDAPGTRSVKLEILTESRIDDGGVRFVPCDFATEDWSEKLVANGLDFDVPTMFVWEGVTMYLPPPVVLDTLTKVASSCVAGSCVGFDYFFTSWALTPHLRRVSRMAREPWLFALDGPAEAEELVRERAGLEVWEHLRYREVVRRYLPTHFDGRPLGYLDDFGGFLLAGKA